MVRWALLVLVTASVGAAVAGTRTTVTVWAVAPPVVTAYGGATYGGYAPPSGAMITEQRELDVEPNTEVRISGVAATVDPASVQLRDLTEPSVAVREQR